MIATAFLRIYLPAGRVVGLAPHRKLNEDGALQIDGPFVWTEGLDDDAIYTMWEGDQFACPRNVRLRMLEGIVAFSRTEPSFPLISEDERDEFLDELSKLKRSSVHGRSYILSSAWHVPLRWFSAFHASERDVYKEGGITSIRYRTSTGEAIDRVRWSSSVLDTAGFTDQVVERVNELSRWLAEFPADSMVELDYARVATLFGEGDLVFDESALDIRESLLALEAEDFERSGEAYQRVARRWGPAQAYTFVN
jgi:hypothetical protein